MNAYEKKIVEDKYNAILEVLKEEANALSSISFKVQPGVTVQVLDFYYKNAIKRITSDTNSKIKEILKSDNTNNAAQKQQSSRLYHPQVKQLIAKQYRMNLYSMKKSEALKKTLEYACQLCKKPVSDKQLRRILEDEGVYTRKERNSRE